MASKPPTETEVLELGSLAEAAEVLHVTPKTVRNLIGRGQLQGFRVGPRLIRVDMRQVRTLLQPIEAA